MKTLFFVFAYFLSGTVWGFADDRNSWHAVTANDFPGQAAPWPETTLPNLEKALKLNASINDIVIHCGLPAAAYDPAKDPPLGKGIVMSGGLIYHDGVLLGEEDYLRFRFDLPGKGQVYVATDRNRRVQYAFYNPVQGPYRYLVERTAEANSAFRINPREPLQK